MRYGKLLKKVCSTFHFDWFAQAVAAGPVSVAIEADQRSFQNYKSGTLSGVCGNKLDHGVLAVGYGADYWIVKNSWGALAHTL